MISITNVINVTLLNTASGLNEINPDTIALFTSDTPNSTFGTAAYKMYLSPDDVATDFGSTSDTYLQAAAIFSQTPNPLTGSGYLVVIPLLELSAATAGYMVTGAPGATLAQFQAITTGSFVLSVDGTSAPYTGLDFHTAEDFDDVATVIDTAITAVADCVYDATLNNGDGGFKITSKTTGALSAVSALSAHTEGVDISSSAFLNGRADVAIVVLGQANGATESIPSAILRTKSSIWYYGVLSTEAYTDAQLTEIAAFIQTMDKMFFYASYDLTDVTGIFTTLKDAGYTHTRMLIYVGDLTDATSRLFAAAYAGRGLSTNFNGSNTCSTMNLKSLVGISPDSTINDASFAACKIAGVDCYANIGDGGSVYSFGANDFFDNVYNEAWFKFAIEVAGFNFLKQTNTKIAQTEQGMEALKNAYTQVCKLAIKNGFLAPGSWTSPTTFGDPEDLIRNISETGYYMYSEPIALQGQSQRELRKAPLIQLAIKLAGAIHSSDMIIYVNK